MIRIYFSPIVWEKDIRYSFDGKILKVEMDGETDEFDFSGLPDGVIEVSTIETSLPHNVIVSAEQSEGILYVEVLSPIRPDATEFEKFPNWIEVQ